MIEKSQDRCYIQFVLIALIRTTRILFLLCYKIFYSNSNCADLKEKKTFLILNN